MHNNLLYTALSLMLSIAGLSLNGQSHNLSLSGGYSFPMEKGSSGSQYKFRYVGQKPSGSYDYEEVKPTFMQGYSIDLGYEYFFNRFWSLWADLGFIQGIGFSTVSRNGAIWPANNYAGIQEHTIESQNYALRAGMALSIGRQDQYYRNKFSKRVYGQLRAGLTYNEPLIRTTSRSTPDSPFDEVRAKSTLKGYGVGGRASARIAFRCSRYWDIFLQGNIEKLTYRHTGIKYDYKTFGSVDELNPPDFYDFGTQKNLDYYRTFKVPLNHYSVMLGVSYNFGNN